MRTLLSRLRREERGIALVLALGMLVTLAITVTGIIEYTGSNSRAAEVNHGRQDASSIAEAGVNAAYSVLDYWDTGTNTGNNATDSQLLGCDAAGVCTLDPLLLCSAVNQPGGLGFAVMPAESPTVLYCAPRGCTKASDCAPSGSCTPVGGASFCQHN